MIKKYTFPLLLLFTLPISAKTTTFKKTIKRYSAEVFHNTVRLRGVQFSSDEKSIVYASDETGIFNVYQRDISTGQVTALTNSKKEAVHLVSTFLFDQRILVSSDQGGNEVTHVYLRKKDGALVDLTPGENAKADFHRWSKDGSRFWITTNGRDPRFFDLYEYEVSQLEVTNYKPKLVFENTGGFSLQDLDPYGRYLALTKTNNNADSDLYLANLGTGEVAKISNDNEDVAYGSYSYSPNGMTLYYGSNLNYEFSRAWSYDIDSKKHTLIHQNDWGINFYGYSRNGKFLLISSNEDGRSRLVVKETNTGKDLEIDGLPNGQVSSLRVARSEQSIAFYLSVDTASSNLYHYDLSSKKLSKLSNTMNPAIDESDMVASETVRFQSFDGVVVPGILYKPKGASKQNKVPAMLFMHGGPGGQSRPGYSPMIQHLVNHGYAVFAVNNRGSSGYGKTFFHLDDRNHGDGDLKDCVWGKKHLQSLDWIESDRIGIMGGSYGGYLTLAGLAFTPKEFKVGIDIFGVSNWIRTLENIPAWWESFRSYLYSEVGDPVADEERLRASSPLFHAKNIERPLLVIQGANDPRVLKVESDEIVEKARANGAEVEYLIFDDEGHGFAKRTNTIKASESMLEFLNNYL